MDERMKQQLAFSLEIDKEKNIFRQTHLSGHGRRENDAEHAWHLAMLALVLGEMVDRGIARFATGEAELSDETYAAWLDELRAAGSGELAALFADAQ